MAKRPPMELSAEEEDLILMMRGCLLREEVMALAAGPLTRDDSGLGPLNPKHPFWRSWLAYAAHMSKLPEDELFIGHVDAESTMATCVLPVVHVVDGVARTHIVLQRAKGAKNWRLPMTWTAGTAKRLTLDAMIREGAKFQCEISLHGRDFPAVYMVDKTPVKGQPQAYRACALLNMDDETMKPLMANADTVDMEMKLFDAHGLDLFVFNPGLHDFDDAEKAFLRQVLAGQVQAAPERSIRHHVD